MCADRTPRRAYRHVNISLNFGGTWFSRDLVLSTLARDLQHVRLAQTAHKYGVIPLEKSGHVLVIVRFFQKGEDRWLAH